MKFFAVCLLIATASLYAFGQSSPSLRIVTEDPNLPSELYYGDQQVKPLRLRPGTNQPMVFEDNDYFVFQQYVDFLGRIPDQAGFEDWNRVLNTCTNQGKLGAEPGCDRVHVSSGFFRSTEFGERGYWIYRFFHATLSRLPKYAEWKPESQRLSGFNLTPQQLEEKKQAFINDFMARPEFTARYGSLMNPQNASAFVNKLIESAGLTTVTNKDQLISDMASGAKTPGQVVRTFIEGQEVWDRFFFRAFVAMEYFGYLKRDPDQAGYDDWVDVLTNGRASAGIGPGDYRHLIFGFIWSVEYRNRF